MIPIIGVLGVATEASGWYFTQGSLQNAADAAAMAAAANITNGGSPVNCTSTTAALPGTPCAEARAVFARYGYANLTHNVAVETKADQPCPSGGTTCYQVEVTKLFPIRLLAVTGFRGDTQVGAARYQAISAAALVGRGTTAGNSYCVLALGTSGTNPAFRTNGAPKADLSGCNVMSNNDATCNGHDTMADVGDAAGTNTTCGVVKNSNVAAVSDPYAALASNLPTGDGCLGAYPQTPKKKDDLVSTNKWSGVVPWNGTVKLCGDQQITGDVTIEHDTTLIIYNGGLDIAKNKTIKTALGVSATIVFAGSNGAYVHAPTGEGTLDITAPTSGPWSGIVMYQAPSLTTGVDISYSGNTPTWNLTGMVYLPHASVTFSGAVNKASNGKSCFGMVVDNLLINGKAKILEHGECRDAGLTLPSGSQPGRMVLLQ